jgi:hypothetical protein
MATRVVELWDRPIVRRPVVLLAVVVLALGIIRYVQNQHPHVATYPGHGPTPFKVDNSQYGPVIKMPKQALAMATAFVQTAVVRRDVAKSWAMVAPSLKAGFTLAQWKTGAIPVVPFPRAALKSVDLVAIRVRAKDILFQANLTSKSVQYQGQENYLELVPVDGRWLVSYYLPKGANPPLPAAGTP